MQEEIRNVRGKELAALESRIATGTRDLERMVLQGGKQEVEAGLEALKLHTADLKSRSNPLTKFDPFLDWKAAGILKDWRVDGFLLNKDDDEQNQSDFQAGAGDSGVVLNVALAGPCAVRNSAQGSGVQLFDPSPWVMDGLYMILVCSAEIGGGGEVVRFTFKYKPSSGRIIERLARDVENGTVTDMNASYPCEPCISAFDVANAVAAFRVGRVMDNKLVSAGAHEAIKANVCVEEMDRRQCVALFGGGFGDMHARAVYSMP
jgi:hypothetical protein